MRGPGVIHRGPACLPAYSGTCLPAKGAVQPCWESRRWVRCASQGYTLATHGSHAKPVPTFNSASTPSSSSTNLREEPSATSRPSVSTCSLPGREH